MNPRVALLSFLAWDPNYRIANAASVEIVFGDMLPRMESTAPPAMGLGKHATGPNNPHSVPRLSSPGLSTPCVRHALQLDPGEPGLECPFQPHHSVYHSDMYLWPLCLVPVSAHVQ